MSKQPGVAASAVEPPDLAVADSSARVVSIDILRGLAILWVIVYHIWGDMTLHWNNTPGLYSDFLDRLLAGSVVPASTALGEVILGQGYLGVPLFMMLSGLSLTLNASRRGEPGVLRGYVARFRRILPVYWAGILIGLATVVTIALLRTLIDGASFDPNILWDDEAWSFSVVPWLFRDKNFTLPIGSLWFVELLLQYYLIFPLALKVLKRVGPWYFVLAGIAITIALRSAYIPWARDSIQALHAARYLGKLAPFRCSEFAIGMTLGYLLAQRREEMARWVRAPADIAGVLVAGIAMVVVGVMLLPEGDPQAPAISTGMAELAVSEVLVQLGLAMLIIPLLFKPSGRLEVTFVARALVFLGVISFTALIVSDSMRIYASFLREEDVTGPPWWFFLWVVYVPVGTLLAYPLARLFGLLPEQRVRAGAPVAGGAALTPPARKGSRTRSTPRRRVHGRARP